MKALLRSNEAARLNALRQYDILDTPPEEAFDDLTRLAAQICGAPIALISLVDADRQWFKSKIGLEALEAPRDVTFCDQAILKPNLFIIRDTHQDVSFVGNPLIALDPNIRFYIGAPLITPDNFALGTLCLIDYVPRDLSPEQQEALRILANQVIMQLESRRNLAALKEAIVQRQQVETALQQAHNELEIRVKERTTELRQVNEQLQDSEKRLQAILDNSTALIYVKDLRGRFILINRCCDLIHLNPEEVIGKTDYDLFPKEMADVYRLNDQKVLEARTALECEEVTPQGNSLHTYLAIKFPLYDVTGVPYAICSISTDITQRKQAEEALRSSVATNRALLNALPDLMFRISKAGIFVNFKAAKDSNLLMLPKEFLGKNVYEVLPQEVARSTMFYIEQALQTGEIQIFEYHLLLNNNRHDYEARIVVSAQDEVITIVRDITKRKRAEEEIRNALEKEKELNELKSRFVTMTSHEFRTPLTTILSSTELVQDYGSKWAEEKKNQHFQRIKIAIKYMTQLLDDVLLIGKVEAGKLEYNPALIDVEQLCRNLVDEMQISNAHHTISFCSQGDCKSVYMDEKLLRHILSNLISNAIKYSPQAGSVDFYLACEQEEAIFQIQDHGIGIPVADQSQLFDSFHRASNVGTISGTGLGLSIVKKSVDLHGGKIAVASVVGVGTTFTVTLPLNKQV